MNKVLVIGGSGALGRQLTRDFSDLEVISTHNSNPTQTSIYLDITNQEQVNQVINSTNPDTIILSSAMTNVAQCEANPEQAKRVNIQGTQNVLNSLNTRKLVFLSTDMVFNGSKKEYTEQHTTHPVNVYGRTKAQAEQLVRKNPNTLICRTARLYGKETGKLLNFYLNKLSQQEPIQVPKGNTGNFTYIPDLSKAIRTLLDRGEIGTYHLAGPAYSLPDAAYEICDYLDVDRNLVDIVDENHFNDLQKVQRASVVLSTKKAESRGLEFKSIRQGLEEMLPKKAKVM